MITIPAGHPIGYQPRIKANRIRSCWSTGIYREFRTGTYYSELLCYIAYPTDGSYYLNLGGTSSSYFTDTSDYILPLSIFLQSLFRVRELTYADNERILLRGGNHD